MNLRHLATAAAAAVFALAAAADDGKPADTTPKLASGLLMQQGGKLVFAPCRDRSYSLVDDISPGGAVTAALRGVGLDAGKKLYVELVAVLEGDSLKASGLNFARTDGRCQTPGGPDEAWRAVGSDPAWSLAAGGDLLILKRAGKADLSFPFGAAKAEGEAANYQASAGGNQLSFRFQRGACRDKGGDTVFGWSATIKVNGDTLKGCAWQR